MFIAYLLSLLGVYFLYTLIFPSKTFIFNNKNLEQSITLLDSNIDYHKQMLNYYTMLKKHSGEKYLEDLYLNNTKKSE